MNTSTLAVKQVKPTLQIVQVNRLGKWVDSRDQVLLDRELEQYPTYFSIKLGVYKVVPMESL